MWCETRQKQPEKMTRCTMLSDVVYYHCSEFQIFRSLNCLHFSILSLYPNSVQTRHDSIDIFLTTANQNKLTLFSHVLCPCHFGQSREASLQKLTNRWFFPSVLGKQKQNAGRQAELIITAEPFQLVKLKAELRKIDQIT